ncbi:unnamed protein product, partial [Closterium sp. Naga37s-1]
CGGPLDTRFGDLLEAEEDSTMVPRAMAVLSQQLGGSGPAKLAMRALLATPVPWQRWLDFPTVLPCSAGSPSLRNILENGQVISMKRLKEGWKGTRSQTYKQEKWAARWGRHINWKWVVATRDSLAVPSRPRDVLIRLKLVAPLPDAPSSAHGQQRTWAPAHMGSRHAALSMQGRHHSHPLYSRSAFLVSLFYTVAVHWTLSCSRQAAYGAIASAMVAHSAWEVVTDSHLDPSAPLFNLLHSMLSVLQLPLPSSPS